MASSSDLPVGGRAVFTSSDFTLYEISRFFIVLALEMQSVAVGWQVYEITRRPLDLGYVGLAQFLPGVLLFLFSGHAADRFNRRGLLMVCYTGFALCSALLFEFSRGHTGSVSAIFAVLVLLGVVRSFNGPVSRALLPQLVREEHFQSAVAWNSGIFQAASIMGPSVGGLVYALFRGPKEVYALAMSAGALAVALTFKIHPVEKSRQRGQFNTQTVLAGLRYVWRQKIILGSISLDMFAVLLGGAVALLPVYASEILKTGPWGLGLLRSAPGIGAGTMALALAHRPLRRRVGAIMLWCVAGFGVFTIVFGLSRSIVISMIALVLVGATDMVSVVIRGTLIQIATPDEMRGRVNAVDMLFIGVSNEFGEFESGLTAHWFGTVPAVVLGGIGTLAVIAIWAWRFPELRKANRLTVEELAGV